MKILALTDGRPGNDNQTLAVAEKLSTRPKADLEIKRIEFNPLAILPDFLIGNSAIGIKTDISELSADLVIATGRKLARVSRLIKQRTNCKNIQLMWPHHATQDFDMIFAPKHDDLAPAANLHQTIGAPNKIDKKYLRNAANEFIGRLPKLDGEKTALLLGDISREDAKILAQKLSEQHKPVYVTTSRRTKQGIRLLFKVHLTCDNYFFNWHNGGDNPYAAILAIADNIIVTADSVGMISEACTTGKPVYIVGKPKKAKFLKFYNYLLENNKAQSFEENFPHKPENSYKPLDTRNSVVSEIRKFLKLKE
ncbi:MAG: hypothetical protein COV36_03855 [Alphaproteobacteria bacterium CG11_big_fil_rev_8_21_14_0_20_44_7]|nr:MAG: hypothetical protein COV36_03855 [Alphaproteobacteria bacterium CG11_big_fil_rev_8_21_14_0_20_44_7]